MTTLMCNLRPVVSRKLECLHFFFSCACARRLILPSLLLTGLRLFSFGDDTILQRPQRAAAEISFRTCRSYLIVVEGKIGSLNDQNLLLDTGSNPSMIDRKLVARLGVQGSPHRLSVFSGSIASESVMLSELQFGPVERRDLRVMVADFSAISRQLGTRIDAVVGLDVLGGANFSVDYARRRISFAALAEPHTATFTAGPQFMIVNLKNGTRLFHLLVDTGATELVLFRDHLHAADYQWTNATGTGHSVSGAFRLGLIVLTQARIGSHDMGPQPALVTASRKEIGTELDGLLGLSCLRPKTISFDFEHGLMGWSD
jgi:predicted aspartyl protease